MVPPAEIACYLHLRNPGHVHMPSVAALAEFEQALTAFGDHPARCSFYASDNDWQKAFAAHRHALFTRRTVLYHERAIASAPRRQRSDQQRKLHAPTRMAKLLERYLDTRRAQQARPATISKIDAYVRHFAAWIVAADPAVDAFSDVRRDHRCMVVLSYHETVLLGEAHFCGMC